MIHRLRNYWCDIRDRQRIAIGLAKGAAMMPARCIDLRHPATWEFSGFSQNGEDGILDVLRRNLLRTNRYFVEVGSADGIDNNSAWLVIAEKYNGLMIEGNSRLVERAKRVVTNQSIGLECHELFVSVATAPQIYRLALHHDPDVFSLDIDGNDYYVAKSLLDVGFRPKIFVVEYNSVFGPTNSVTIPYRDDFTFVTHSTQLYYGVSITGWRKFFTDYGYRFVTVDRNGVNGFFVAPEMFDSEFLRNVQPLEYAENQYQYKKFRIPSSEQFRLIADQSFVTI